MRECLRVCARVRVRVCVCVCVCARAALIADPPMPGRAGGHVVPRLPLPAAMCWGQPRHDNCLEHAAASGVCGTLSLH